MPASPTNTLTNQASLFIKVMGKFFEVTHICSDIHSANEIMAKDASTTFIAEDSAGHILLAKSTPMKKDLL